MLSGYPVPVTRRILFVHAHPDDECIGTGATMAKYVSEGAQVTLVTCTLGEEGEVLLPDLSHLASDKDDALGSHRREELAAAMAILGVTDSRLLGGPGRFRDSGMIGTPANERPDCFWRTDILEAAVELVAVIRETRPQVVVTYDDFGGYGHPDHIQAHRVTHYAVALAESPTFRTDLGEAWTVSKLYWTALPRGVVVAGIEAAKAKGIDNEFTAMDPDDLPFACADELVTTAVVATEFVPQKLDALRAHGTQVSTEDGFLGFVQLVGPEPFGTEHFRLARGVIHREPGAERESDLFAGIAE